MDEKKVEKSAVQKPKMPETAKKVPGFNERKVGVMFRENRKFDLHVGRDMITFMGREQKQIPVSWTKHKDFKQVQSLFVVKGV